MKEIIETVMTVEITGSEDEVLLEVATELGAAYQEIGELRARNQSKRALLEEAIPLLDMASAEITRLAEANSQMFVDAEFKRLEAEDKSLRQQETIARLQDLLAEARDDTDRAEATIEAQAATIASLQADLVAARTSNEIREGFTRIRQG